MKSTPELPLTTNPHETCQKPAESSGRGWASRATNVAPREPLALFRFKVAKRGRAGNWRPRIYSPRSLPGLSDGTDFKNRIHCTHRGKLEAEQKQDFIWWFSILGLKWGWEAKHYFSRTEIASSSSSVFFFFCRLNECGLIHYFSGLQC